MNGGYKATPHIVKRISDADGKVLYENRYDNPPRVLSEEIAATMNGMLSRVITEGTGKPPASRVGRQRENPARHSLSATRFLSATQAT